MKLKGSLFWQRMALAVVCVLIACYTFYHMLGLFDTEMETYAASVTTETKVISYGGYLFRDETVLTSSHTGVVEYRALSGVKVSEGQELALVYTEGDTALREEIRRIDHHIAVLEESLTPSSAIPDMSQLQSELNDRYVSIVKLLGEGNAVGLSLCADDFLVSLNRTNSLLYGEHSPGYQTLEELRSARQAVMNEAGDYELHRASQSGYFYTYTDGYEELFTMDAVSEDRLDGDSFYGLIAQMEDGRTPEEDAFGKLCHSSEWRLVLPVSPEDGAYFEEGMTYSGTFGGNTTFDIPLTLEYTKEATEQGTLLLVFSADRMPDGFSFDRSQNVSIEVSRASGIYVPKSVVVRENGGRGVYILRGSVVRFRYVEILYEGSDYYLVEPNKETDQTGRAFLQVNDVVILNGKNLFDGRVMD